MGTGRVWLVRVENNAISITRCIEIGIDNDIHLTGFVKRGKKYYLMFFGEYDSQCNGFLTAKYPTKVYFSEIHGAKYTCYDDEIDPNFAMTMADIKNIAKKREKMYAKIWKMQWNIAELSKGTEDEYEVCEGGLEEIIPHMNKQLKKLIKHKKNDV